MASTNLNTIATMVKQGLAISALPEEIRDAVNTIKDLTVDFAEESRQAAQLAATLLRNAATLGQLYENLPETATLKQQYLLEQEKKRLLTEHQMQLGDVETQKQKLQQDIESEKSKLKLEKEYTKLEQKLNRKITKAKTQQDITNLQAEVAATDFDKYAEVIEEDAAELFAIAIDERKKELEPTWSASREADKAARQKADFLRKQKDLLEELNGLDVIFATNFGKIMSEETLQKFKAENGGELPRSFRYLGVHFNRHTLYTDRYFIQRPKQKKVA